MTTYTPRYSFPRIESSDNIKQSNSATKLGEDINRVSDRAEAVIAGVDEKATSSVSTSINAKQAADAAAARNLLQDLLLQQNDLRIRALEAMGSLSPGSVTDGTIASTVNNSESLTREALGSAFVARGTITHDVRDYGAKGDNATDDSAAFTAAIAAAKATRGRAYAYGTFRLDQPIVVDSNADFGDAIVNYYGTGVAFTVSGWRLKVSMPSIFNGLKSHGGGWDHVAGSVGVRMLNTNGCDIEVKFVQGFEQGLSVYGLNGGSAYNTVYLGWLFNNKIGQICDTYSSTGIGYSNQNTFIGGRISMHSSEMEGYPEGTKGVPGTKALYTTGDGDGGPNSNLWLNTCLEGATQEYAFDINKGRNNKLINVRLEYGNACRFGPGARDNEVTVGYYTEQLNAVREDQGGYGNDLNYARWGYKYDKQDKYFATGDSKPWANFSTGQRRLFLGPGADVEPTSIRGGTGYIAVDGQFRPDQHGVHDLGAGSYRWRRGFFTERVSAGLGVDYGAGAQAPASAGLARTYGVLKEDGKMELRVRWPSGGFTVLGTEP